MTETTEKKEEKKLGNRILLLDEIQDPGNLGTIIRSATAFPLSQARSIGSTIYGANLAVERANGYKWSAKTNIEKKTVTVTRTQ